MRDEICGPNELGRCHAGTPSGGDGPRSPRGWVSYCVVAWSVVIAACAACSAGDTDLLSVPSLSAMTVVMPTASATRSTTPTSAPMVTGTPSLQGPAPGQTDLATATASAVTPTAVLSSAAPVPSATPGRPQVYVDLADGNLDVFVRMTDGAVINLTYHPSADAYASLSPDGQQVLFVSNRDGPSHVFLVGVDGSNLVRLTDSEYGDTLPQWSPDGQRIAYQTLLTGHNWEIFSMQPDGSQKVNLTNNPAIDVSPSWSPDGRLLAFETNRDGDFEIYTMAADGSSPTNVTKSAAAYDISPVWSDAEQIRFRSDRGGARFEYQWYTINSDGSELRPVEE